MTPGFSAISARAARFGIGQVVRHRLFDFRGVVFDVDPEFANSEEWYQAIPEEIRPAKDQPLGSSRVDLQACKLEYSIVSPK